MHKFGFDWQSVVKDTCFAWKGAQIRTLVQHATQSPPGIDMEAPKYHHSDPDGLQLLKAAYSFVSSFEILLKVIPWPCKLGSYSPKKVCKPIKTLEVSDVGNLKPFSGWRDNTNVNTPAWESANSELDCWLNIQLPQILPEVIDEHRARSQPWSQPGVTNTLTKIKHLFTFGVNIYGTTVMKKGQYQQIEQRIILWYRNSICVYQKD